MIHVKKGQLGPKVCVKEWLIYWPNGVFGFAVLGIELAKYPWQCISWKNGNSWWICEVKKSVLKLLRLAIRKILHVYEKKRELASIPIELKRLSYSRTARGSEVKDPWTLCAQGRKERAWDLELDGYLLLKIRELPLVTPAPAVNDKLERPFHLSFWAQYKRAFSLASNYPSLSLSFSFGP